MKFVKYKTNGVCSREIDFSIQNNKIKDISFLGGCGGNLSAISTLIDGMEINEVISKLKNIKCGTKSSSCPKQLALALEEYKNNNAGN